jgi:hypothetical protein
MAMDITYDALGARLELICRVVGFELWGGVDCHGST